MEKSKEFNLYGTDFFGKPIKPPSKGTMSDHFILPPFSVLNAREGVWQSRKRRWLSLGIESEVGRGEALTCGISIDGRSTKDSNIAWTETGKQKNKGQPMANSAINSLFGRPKKAGDNQSQTGTSIFDPVLCELMYKWFCPKQGQIVDPFAGGSVRGIVAHLLDYKYWSCDLRQEQIDANYEQAEKITPDDKPTWITGDSIDKLQEAPKADFIFSCPPYGDLEKYSNDKKDLSNMEYHTFIAAMKRIILRCYKQLKNNRFACFIVGDFRDKKGFYRNFISDTISCFIDNNFKLYNEAILVTVTGSLPIRVTKQFNASRKMGKTHQNILVFVKGNPKIATKEITGE